LNNVPPIGRKHRPGLMQDRAAHLNQKKKNKLEPGPSSGGFDLTMIFWHDIVTWTTAIQVRSSYPIRDEGEATTI
jgi:hypothetical protein